MLTRFYYGKNRNNKTNIWNYEILKVNFSWKKLKITGIAELVILECYIDLECINI